ncbi:uncharacterized protein YecT (DUF1311 family) [Pelomonas aquatica]|uniref:Uncharacterized protein YecT (DUF1311 family) n=1 Tax=Pelomonas aquatica TaxID=431058 RepID=A0ABU1Z4S8_9BURK|nr:uncharacterized protein YecT (DUF1311 family) [Pelomonas aquatica]
MVWQQLMPLGFAGRIPVTVFSAGTRVASIEPIRYDTELVVAECKGQFTVDASSTIDIDTARTIEVGYARQPDLVLMLSLLLSQPPKGRVYDFEIVYSSQLKGGQNYVRVAGLNEFKMLVTGGFLAGKAVAAEGGAADGKTLASAQREPTATPVAAATQATAEEETPADVAERAFVEADKKLNAAYKSAMNAASTGGKAKLRDEQRKWITRRDKACPADPDAGIGRNSKGELDAMACATTFTRNRTGELIRMAGGFVCPESLPTDAMRQQESKRFLDGVANAHPNWTLADVIAHRVALLTEHGCTQTLENFRQAGGR